MTDGAKPSIVLVSRTLLASEGGDVAEHVRAAAQVLSPIAEVTVLTSERHAGDAEVPGATVARVPHPPDSRAHASAEEAYAAAVLQRVIELFPDGGPDLVECADRGAEGYAVVLAAAGGDGRLRRTRVACRLRQSTTIAERIDGRVEADGRLRAMEDLVLQEADVLLAGTASLAREYRTFHPDLDPGRVVVTGQPFVERTTPASPAPADGPLRVLFPGPIARGRGISDLVAALTAIDAEWQLTVAGPDTATGPLGASMAGVAELDAPGDPRIVMQARSGPGQLPELLSVCDLAVFCGRWEATPDAALQALAAGVPLVVTPTGDLPELVSDGVTGWVARASGPHALRDALGPLVFTPSAARELAGADAIAARLDATTDPDAIRARYADVLAAPVPRRTGRGPTAPGPRTPLVSCVVVYDGDVAALERTLASCVRQTHPRLELVVVNDGCFSDGDWALAEVVARHPVSVVSQPPRGLAAARNLGVTQSLGAYVVVCDGGVKLHPTLVARGVALLERRRELAYVAGWSGDREADDDAPTAPILRRRVFDRHAFDVALTHRIDSHFFAGLRADEMAGFMLPDRLVTRARVTHPDDSPSGPVVMSRERLLRWVSRSA